MGFLGGRLDRDLLIAPTAEAESEREREQVRTGRSEQDLISSRHPSHDRRDDDGGGSCRVGTERAPPEHERDRSRPRKEPEQGCADSSGVRDPEQRLICRLDVRRSRGRKPVAKDGPLLEKMQMVRDLLPAQELEESLNDVNDRRLRRRTGERRQP